MAACVRLLRAKLPRLALIYFHKSRPFITAVLRFSSSNCSRWQRLHLPPRKSLHWGIALGSTAGLLCSGVALCASSGMIIIMCNVIFVYLESKVDFQYDFLFFFL